MKVHLKTVLKLDKVGFSLSILMVCYLAGFHLFTPYESVPGKMNSGLLHILPLIYALVMSLLCGLNVLKMSEIRKKYIKPNHRRFHTGLSRAEE